MNTDNRRKTTDDRGFTLVEVMIAMVVMLIGMMGVMSMQYYSIGGNAFSREMRIATGVTQEMVEQIEGTPYANLTLIAPGTDNPLPVFTDPGAIPPTVRATSGNVLFTRRWWILPNCTELGPNGNLCTLNPAPACTTVPDAAIAQPASAVRVRTCWTDVNGVNHSVFNDFVRWDETN